MLVYVMHLYEPRHFKANSDREKECMINESKRENTKNVCCSFQKRRKKQQQRIQKNIRR